MKFLLAPRPENAPAGSYNFLTPEGDKIRFFPAPNVSSATPPLSIHEYPTLEDAVAALSLTAVPKPEAPAPAVRVPKEIANWRARAILTQDNLLASVEALIAGLPSPDGDAVRFAWAGGAPLARGGATVTALAGALGLTEAQVDDMFIRAAALTV